MKKPKSWKQLILTLGTVLIFAACGESTEATTNNAIDKITNYAQNGGTTPILQDYLDAGVVGVTETNLADINQIVENLTKEEVDTKEEIQTLVSSSNVSLSPIAKPTASKSNVTEGRNIRFSGESSTDADGNIVKYVWKEGDIILHEISVFDKSNLSVGTHTLTLTVTDNDGNTNSASVKVTIKEKVAIAVSSSSITHNGTTYGFVTSPTGRIWLDKNLGASRVCTVFNDVQCYGDYYQWGRNFDGHEDSASGTDGTQATNVNSVGHGDFITGSIDWASVDGAGAARETNWSKTDGSFVCPIGFRVPTVTELSNELSGLISNRDEAFQSFLKLPVTGYRNGIDNTEVAIGDTGFIWATPSVGTRSSHMSFGNGSINFSTNSAFSSHGMNIRCIKG